MKILNTIQNIIIYLSLVFIFIASSFFMITFLELPLNGRMTGFILVLPVYNLYNRLKIKEEE